MIIDEFLGKYDVAAKYQVNIQAPGEFVYKAVRDLDLSGSRIVRLLFRLRELPALFDPKGKREGLGLTLDDLIKSGFILLGENPPHEIVLGVVGRFWTPSGCIQRLDVDGFRAFCEEDFAKAVWNFSLTAHESALTTLTTETRVLCLGQGSRKRFRLYWTIVGPFSGVIRKEALETVRLKAEAAWRSFHSPPMIDDLR
jgi:hypothetical protein